MSRLFITQRELDFMSDLTKEVTKDVVGHKIYYYHVREDLSNVNNVYEESTKKVFDAPIEIECRIDWGTPEVKTTKFGYEQMWNVEAFIHYRDMYDRDIELHTGDYFSYGSVFFEVTSYHIEKFMFGQVERIAGYRLVGKQTRVDHIDLVPKGPTEESFTGPDAIQKTFVQQRGNATNDLGKTGDIRQLRKDGKLEDPIGGPQKVSPDGTTGDTDGVGSSFYDGD